MHMSADKIYKKALIINLKKMICCNITLLYVVEFGKKQYLI